MFTLTSDASASQPLPTLWIVWLNSANLAEWLNSPDIGVCCRACQSPPSSGALCGWSSGYTRRDVLLCLLRELPTHVDLWQIPVRFLVARALISKHHRDPLEVVRISAMLLWDSLHRAHICDLPRLAIRHINSLLFDLTFQTNPCLHLACILPGWCFRKTFSNFQLQTSILLPLTFSFEFSHQLRLPYGSSWNLRTRRAKSRLDPAHRTGQRRFKGPQGPFHCLHTVCATSPFEPSLPFVMS